MITAQNTGSQFRVRHRVKAEKGGVLRVLEFTGKPVLHLRHHTPSSRRTERATSLRDARTLRVFLLRLRGRPARARGRVSLRTSYGGKCSPDCPASKCREWSASRRSGSTHPRYR